MASARRLTILLSSLCGGLVLSASPARADVIVVGPAAFPAGSPLITFAGVPDLTEVNGLLFGGIQFSYSLGDNEVIINGGPGPTNNIDPPNVVSVGNGAGILRLLLPGLESVF